MRIGIFDSGFGGLTIFKCIRERLPLYDYLYLGDNARAPYGTRSFQAVLQFTTEAVRYLFTRQCQLIVIACNTASAKALRSIQQRVLPASYPDRRVLGVIRPSVEELGRQTHTGTVALWATQGTVRSESFVLELEKFASNIKLIQQACPLLVPLVESGELDGAGVEFYVQKYWTLTSRQSSQIDTLLLACTHYPLLLSTIRSVVSRPVNILVQGDFVAPSLQDYLRRHPEIEGKLTRGASVRFLTTDQSEEFDRLAQIFLGHSVRSEQIGL
ncbi:MAG TPA: glutamate racemase [Acidobacteriota bacterium]